jgi:N-acetylglucosamine-6-phosphate deacetylase
LDQFSLDGRRVLRRSGRLELADGTLAGADLTLVTAVKNVARWTGRDVAEVLPMATAAPLALIGRTPPVIETDQLARLLIWRAGQAEARIDGSNILPLARR